MPKPNISSGRTRITTTIRTPLLARVRLMAASQGVSLNIVIEEALTEYFDGEQTNMVHKIEKLLSDT